jgi:hypothetical protein
MRDWRRTAAYLFQQPFVQRKWAMTGKSFRLRNPGLIVTGAAVALLTILLQFGAGKAAAFAQQVCDIEADSALGLENYYITIVVTAPSTRAMACAVWQCP